MVSAARQIASLQCSSVKMGMRQDINRSEDPICSGWLTFLSFEAPNVGGLLS